MVVPIQIKIIKVKDSCDQTTAIHVRIFSTYRTTEAAEYKITNVYMLVL